eukprot:TRINITY_DN756_c0_g1_i1.p1 TRINITY_DN756_c0_g1~~TRINITY_DN756_c0_g1_i1.p1  ORF type:complete len:269 (-),score=21.77 TRINITY_DN756_c0_g1_i1:337-1143(-)
MTTVSQDFQEESYIKSLLTTLVRKVVSLLQTLRRPTGLNLQSFFPEKLFESSKNTNTATQQTSLTLEIWRKDGGYEECIENFELSFLRDSFYEDGFIPLIDESKEDQRLRIVLRSITSLLILLPPTSDRKFTELRFEYSTNRKPTELLSCLSGVQVISPAFSILGYKFQFQARLQKNMRQQPLSPVFRDTEYVVDERKRIYSDEPQPKSTSNNKSTWDSFKSQGMNSRPNLCLPTLKSRQPSQHTPSQPEINGELKSQILKGNSHQIS